jgi:hypothetical protein
MTTTDSFDHVIVGVGAAGLVLAARLSEDPNIQVLVLEAGEDLTADPRVNVPAMWVQLFGSSADWRFKTSPQEALGSRQIEFRREWPQLWRDTISGIGLPVDNDPLAENILGAVWWTQSCACMGPAGCGLSTPVCFRLSRGSILWLLFMLLLRGRRRSSSLVSDEAWDSYVCKYCVVLLYTKSSLGRELFRSVLYRRYKKGRSNHDLSAGRL